MTVIANVVGQDLQLLSAPVLIVEEPHPNDLICDVLVLGVVLEFFQSFLLQVMRVDAHPVDSPFGFIVHLVRVKIDEDLLLEPGGLLQSHSVLHAVWSLPILARNVPRMKLATVSSEALLSHFLRGLSVSHI